MEGRKRWKLEGMRGRVGKERSEGKERVTKEEEKEKEVRKEGKGDKKGRKVRDKKERLKQ